MHSMRKVIAALLCLMLVVAAAGCSAKKDQPATESAEPAGSASVDRDAVAATVGDLSITVGEMEDTYSEYIEMYSYYGQPVPTEDADIETLQDTVLELLVKEKILEMKAKEKGCDVLTEEQEAELDEAVKAEEDTLITYYLEEGRDSSDGTARAAAIERINADLLNYGMNMEFEEYLESIRDYYKQEYVNENLAKEVKDSAEVSEEEVKAYYDRILEDQTATVGEDPLQYLSGEMDYEMGAGDPMVVVPENFARIKALTVQPESDIDENYDGLLLEMKNLEAEYGNLVLSGSDDKDRIKEIEQDYAARKESAEGMREEYIGSAREKITQAYAELQNGASFDEVFGTYNEDTVYTEYPIIGEKGYLISLTEDDGYWSDEIRAAAAALKEGTYSEILSSDDEFEIVYLVGTEPAGTKSLEDVKEAVTKLALAEKQEELWNSVQDEWYADRSAVQLYPENYRSVGK